VQSVAPNTDDFNYSLPWRKRQGNQSNDACPSGASPARESASASTMASAGSTSENPADDLEYGHILDNEADEIAYIDDSELEVACTANLNFDEFVHSLAEACKLFEYVESGGDLEYFDDGEYAREKSLTMYPLGELPRKDDLSLPKDSMPGFRGKIRLLALFGRDSAAGTLPPLTKIGRMRSCLEGV
jgi:hypothetical protein